MADHDSREEWREDWRTVLARRRAPRRTAAQHRVVLLGTAGGSNPKATRTGYANAVVVDAAAYLVDCGEGAHRQLWRAGLTLNSMLGADRPLVSPTHRRRDCGPPWTSCCGPTPTTSTSASPTKGAAV